MSKRTHKDEALMADGWDEVAGISQTCYQRLSACSIVIPVIELFQQRPDLLQANPEVHKACKALMQDVPALRTELDAIAKLHNDRKGDVVKAEDFLVTIEVSQQYSSWLERFERLIDPNLILVSQSIENLPQEVTKGA